MKKVGKWFCTGHKMSDGKTDRTVYIEGERNIRVAIGQGLKPVEVKKVIKKKASKTVTSKTKTKV